MKNPLYRTLMIFGLFVLVNLPANAKNKLTFKQDLSIAADGISELFVDVGSGSLNIKSGHVNDIIVNATISSKKYSDLEDLQEAFDDKMKFSLESSGSKATLKAMSKKQFFSWSDPNIQIDLDVTVPMKIDLNVDDGSGNLKISGIDGNLEIDDGSGSMQIDDIVGNVLIDDGSGSQELSNIDGNVVIDDGSGSVKMENITGNVTIDDGSGSINITNLGGQFKLIDDGSGSVYVNGKKWIEKD